MAPYNDKFRAAKCLRMFRHAKFYFAEVDFDGDTPLT
jgi:hypothetical protein